MVDSLLERIVRDEARLHIDIRSSYLRSYPEFLRYFQTIPVIQEHHLIIAANFTYGWMPTILRFKSDSFADAVAILNRARTDEMLTDNDLWCLIYLINNSMVGVSKLLHFVNPERYAIWDSRVDTYLRGFPDYVPDYLAYLALCRATIAHPAFPPVHSSLNAKIGYPVTALRAVEVVMYATVSLDVPDEETSA